MWFGASEEDEGKSKTLNNCCKCHPKMIQIIMIMRMMILKKLCLLYEPKKRSIQSLSAANKILLLS
jgi:hypothetical protein